MRTAQSTDLIAEIRQARSCLWLGIGAMVPIAGVGLGVLALACWRRLRPAAYDKWSWRKTSLLWLLALPCLAFFRRWFGLPGAGLVIALFLFGQGIFVWRALSESAPLWNPAEPWLKAGVLLGHTGLFISASTLAFIFEFVAWFSWR